MRPLTLWHAASQRWRNRCPCCTVPMKTGKVKKGRPTPRDHRTVAHVDPVARGGDPKMWIYACHGCNNDQGFLSFAGWARMLLLADDRRAELVIEVARFIDDWRQARREAA